MAYFRLLSLPLISDGRTGGRVARRDQPLAVAAGPKPSTVVGGLGRARRGGDRATDRGGMSICQSQVDLDRRRVGVCLDRCNAHLHIQQGGERLPSGVDSGVDGSARDIGSGWAPRSLGQTRSSRTRLDGRCFFFHNAPLRGVRGSRQRHFGSGGASQLDVVAGGGVRWSVVVGGGQWWPLVGPAGSLSVRGMSCSFWTANRNEKPLSQNAVWICSSE